MVNGIEVTNYNGIHNPCVFFGSAGIIFEISNGNFVLIPNFRRLLATKFQNSGLKDKNFPEPSYKFHRSVKHNK